MSGLRKALITRGMAQSRKAPQRPVPKYGYGGDVDGKDAEGVGGSYGESGHDWGGFASDSSGGLSTGDWADRMDSYADSHDGGETDYNSSSYGGSKGSFSDFGPTTPDGRMNGSSIDWNGALSGATLGNIGSLDLAGGQGDYSGGMGALSGSGVDFGALGSLTGDGRLSGQDYGYTSAAGMPAAADDMNFGVADLSTPEALSPRSPTEGTLQAIALDNLVDAIAKNESQGRKDPYSAVGTRTKDGDRAYGFSQVMGNNIPSWTDQYLGRSMSKREFLGNPDAQIGVTYGRLADLMDKYGPVGASRAWFAGEGGMDRARARDPNKMDVATYGNKVAETLGLSGQPMPTPDVPLPPERPPEVFGPSLWEGDPLAAGRVASLDSLALPGLQSLDQSSLNRALMSELTGPQAQAYGDIADKVGQGRGARAAETVSAPAAPSTASRAPSALSDLAFELGTGIPDPAMDFSLGDIGATPPSGSGKRQERVDERTDLPQLTRDLNAPARATLAGDMAVNARPGPAPASPAAPANGIADAIASFFGFDQAPAPAAVAQAPALAPSFDEVFAEDAASRKNPVATAPAAPASQPALTPEETAAAPNSLPSGIQTAATAMVTPETAPAAQTRSAGSRGAQTAPAATSAVGSGRSASGRAPATAAGDVYGPTMPGMAPGMTSYPERGVINQPSTWAHEKIAERLGAGAARSVGSALTGGLFGLADMGSGFLGGPSLSGIFANSTPGLDLSLGFQEPGDRPSTSAAPAESKPGTTTAKPKPASPGTGGSVQAKPTYARSYQGPVRNPLAYGYGGEQVQWDGDGYARGGYVDCGPKKPVNRGGALPMPRGIKPKAQGYRNG